MPRDPHGTADASFAQLSFQFLKSDLWYHHPLEGAQYYLEVLLAIFTVGFLGHLQLNLMQGVASVFR